jgi:glycosyltransferase involved in cell wall biosynthesis
MVSIIVIGRNEGWKLSKSLLSISKLIEANEIFDIEVIYVDSDSTDDSLSRAKEFPFVKVIQISGDINAAVARNVGVEYSKGTDLFFVDGDMEIHSDFLKKVCDPETGLRREFMSANWMNFFYDQDGNLKHQKIYKNMQVDEEETVTGGLFLIRRKTWLDVNGMDNRFKKSQDIDLGLSLARKGIFILRLKDVGANHHTIEYMDKNRMWDDFKNYHHLYTRSFIYRKHLFNRHMYQRLARNDYSMLILVACLLSLIFSWKIGIAALAIYFILVFLRSKFKPERVLYYALRDISVIFGFFLFYPKEGSYKVTPITF